MNHAPVPSVCVAGFGRVFGPSAVVTTCASEGYGLVEPVQAKVVEL
jgi:hypothetical protein